MKDLIHPTAIIDSGSLIGKSTRVWHFSHIMSDCVIGEDCIIGQNVFVGQGVKLGDRVKVQNNVSVYAGVFCKNDVFIGPSVVFTNVMNPRSFINRKEEFKPTIIEQGASLGANATIICGIVIGQYAFIGAGSVVTANVPDYALVYGNPAKLKGWVSKNGHKLNFGDDQASCPETGEKYIIKNNVVKPVL